MSSFRVLMSPSKKNRSKGPGYFMEKALLEARKAFSKGEVPVGCVIVSHGKIIARGHNSRKIARDPMGHAEMNAIRKASRRLGDFRLNHCELYVTVEPCILCLGAILQSRIRKLVYGCENKNEGALVLLGSIKKKLAMNYKLEVRGKVLSDKSMSLLKSFFRSVRR